MDKAEINIDLAEQYLLGELDEETGFDFEADVFPDKDLSEHLDEIRHELAEKYLARQLTPGQRQRFETHFLASPYNLEVLLSTRALLDSAAEMRTQVLSGASVAKLRTPVPSGAMAWIRSFRLRRFAIPAFASLLLLAGAAFVFLLRNDYIGSDLSHILVPPPSPISEPPRPEDNLPDNVNGNSGNDKENINQTNNNTSNPTPNRQPSPQAQAPTFAMILLPRGSRDVGSKEPVLTIRKTDKTVRLEFFGPEENPGRNFTKYRLNIEDEGGAEVWSSEFSKNENVPNGKKQYQIDAANFKGGTYVFRIMGVPETGAPKNVQKTTFKVTRQGN